MTLLHVLLKRFFQSLLLFCSLLFILQSKEYPRNVPENPARKCVKKEVCIHRHESQKRTGEDLPLLYNTLQSPDLGSLRSHVREEAIIDSHHEELTGETEPSLKSDGHMLNLQSNLN